MQTFSIDFKVFIKTILLSCCLLLSTAQAAVEHPLKPIDTSSPQATINGFLEITESAYNRGIGSLDSYLKSNRLFISKDEISLLLSARDRFFSAGRTLDTSALPPAMAGEETKRLVIQLKEILDRLDYPIPASVPDAKKMEEQYETRWTIPDTEITIARINSGSRTGEYLFTAETVARIPEFYQRIKDQPYLRGSTQGWYENKYKLPIAVAIAFHKIIPSRWIISNLDHTYTLFFGEPLWRWVGFLAVCALSFLFIKSASFIKRRWSTSRSILKFFTPIVQPVFLITSSFISIIIISNILRSNGGFFAYLIPALWVFFYICMTWLVWQAGEVIAVFIINAENLSKVSINSQIIKLLTRIGTISISTLILANGAERIGIPAYSVVASLGVGGLAVALAAQQTVSNLIGSIIIIFEKPFKIGDSIKIADTEGIVKSVGFRSTRIATANGTVVTIPNSQIVNGAVTTRSVQNTLFSHNVLNISLTSGPEKIHGFIDGAKNYLNKRPELDSNKTKVELSRFNGTQVEIILDFRLKPQKDLDATNVRQAIYMDIMNLAIEHGIGIG